MEMQEKNRLRTIQKRENLNEIWRRGERGPGGAFHDYVVTAVEPKFIVWDVPFQKGPRNAQEARNGVLDGDLIEIVRDRLKAFQGGEYACRENEMALMHIEEALMWMNRRVEDRIERNVLGTMKK